MSFTNFIWLIIVPLVSSPVIYLAGRLASRSFRIHYKHNLSRWLALVAVLINWIPLIGNHSMRCEPVYLLKFRPGRSIASLMASA